MISSEKDYLDAMRDMVRKVQQGYEPPFTADAEELEIFGDCIRNGYLLGKTTYIDSDGFEHELRTLDGKLHPELASHVIPQKGLAFLKPKKTDQKASAAILISILALLVSLLSNLDKILENLELLLSFFH